MTDHKVFSDEELIAFLDGETEHCPADAITMALATDSILAARIEALSLDINQMKGAFSGMLASAPAAPDFLNSVPSKPAPNYGWAAMAATILMALGIGFGAGKFSFQQPNTGWKSYVASYQALYSTETLASVNVSKTDKEQQLVRVSSAIGKSIDLSALSVDESIDYKRAQILNFKGKPLIQLAFLSDTGVPYALCILRTENGNPSSIEMQDLENMSSASWSRDGFNYLLIGGHDEEVVSKLAQKYAKTI